MSGENSEITVHLEAESIRLEKIVISADAIPNAEKMFEMPISKVDLSPKQINQIPQVAEADLLRALQTLPGILPVSDFSSALYVRGGTPDQNLYLIDGTDVYNPEHAFGLFSTFNLDAVKKVELSKGGFGADFGGRLSSILNVTNLDGNREEFQATSSISLLSAKTTVQMPLGNIGSFSGSFRRTYFDQTIARVINSIPNYYFFDGNFKVFFDINSKNKLTISGYGGDDVLNFVFNDDASDEAGYHYDWGNRTGSIRWTSVFTPQLFANFWLTGSLFESGFDFGETFEFIETNGVSDLTFKANFEYHHSKNFRSNFGFERKHLHLEFLQDFPGGRIDIAASPKHTVAFIQNNWQPSPRWDIEAGLRFNHFKSDTTFTKFAPRFAAKYRLSDTVNLKTAVGKYYQFLHRAPRAFVADVWSYSNKFQNESSSYHAIFGIQKEVAGDYQLEIESFYKKYFDIYAFNPNAPVDITVDGFDHGETVYSDTEGLFHRGDGRSYGVELLLRKDSGAITGWIGYSLAFTRYRYDNINQGQEFAPRHDRRSTLNIVGTLDIKNLKRRFQDQEPVQHRSNWKLGIAFVYSTGQPITTPNSGYFIRALPDRIGDASEFEYFPSEINSFRLPAYARLDVSLTYEKHYRTWSLYPYIQVFNIGYRKNVWFLKYDIDGFEQDVDPEYMFPILPSIGVKFEF